MTIYDYFQNGKLVATFTSAHESERLHFEALHIANYCKVTKF